MSRMNVASKEHYLKDRGKYQPLIHICTIPKMSAQDEEAENELDSGDIALDVIADRSNITQMPENDQWLVWCSKNISMKECNCFIPATSHAKQRCACGLLRSHHKSMLTGYQIEWSPVNNVKESPTNAFGYVSFSGEKQDAMMAAEYIRLSDSTSVDKLWFMMKHYWSLKPPTLILSIIGGNTDLQLDMDVKKSLEGGLAKVINQTDVWLLTGGTGTPVTSLVTRVFDENHHRERSTKNACIGIVPWGCIPENDSLVGKLVHVMYAPSNNMLEEREKLGEKHTHFLFVDNGTSGKYGIERKFRVKLERFLCNPLDSRAVPSVNLLVHGGYHACMQIRENLQSHPNIPTVVVKGSGRLADILASVLRAFADGKKGLSLLNLITTELKSNPWYKDENEFGYIRGAIKEIVEEHSSKVIVYDPKDDPYGLHHAIMEACKSSSTESMDRFNRLQLAIHLGETEIATHDIQRNGVDVTSLEETLYKSIKKGKAKFVEFLLNYGVKMDKFLDEDKKMLKRLYNTKIKHGNFLNLLMNDSETKQFNLEVVDRLLHNYMDGDYSTYYGQDAFAAEDEKIAMTPIQELIIWAVFNNMTEMVECFWKFDTERALENAFVIFRLFKAMSKEYIFDEIERAELTSAATKYEKLSMDLLSYYYKQNAKTSLDVVKTRIPLWGYKNMVTLAANGASRDFVSHTCCQNYLKDVWLGRAEQKSMRSEVWKLRENLMHPRRRLVSASAMYRQKKFKKKQAKDAEDAPVQSKRDRIRQKFKNIFLFLFFVPKGKLFVHEFIFTIFLGCFAYFVLVKKGIYHDILRYIVFTVITALTIDEIREISEVRKRTVFLKLKEWKRSAWNWLDVLAMVLFYTGFALGYYDFKSAERTIMAVDLMLWVIKFAQFYRMFYTLGPYLIMIYKMMFHMVGFVLVLIIAVVAYGIFMHTLLFPEVSVSWQILFKILFRPYLLVFGELGINSYTLSSNTTVYGTTKVNEGTELIVVIGMCVYLLMANVLLLNMLIAVFNNIYEDVKDNSDKIWRFDKYDMIMEFKRKPAWPMPLSIFTNIPMIFLRLCRNETRRSYFPDDIDLIIDMKDFQNRCTRAFIREYGEKASVEEKLDLLIERTENISKSALDLEERMESGFSKLSKKLAHADKKLL